MSPSDPPSNVAETEASVPPAPEAQPAVAPPAMPADAPAEAAKDDMPDAHSSGASPAIPKAPPEPACDAGPRLKALFPALFVGAPKPIKLRIQQDIQARAPGVFTRHALSAFFRRYTGSTGYLHAVANGRERFDLDGQPAGPIADDHRQAARDELARRRARHEERRALEEQQRRNRAGLLRDYERTTLTRANFCALKQIDEAELDRVLAIAREEAAQMRAAPPGRPPGQQPRARSAADSPDRRDEAARGSRGARAGGAAPGRQGRGRVRRHLGSCSPVLQMPRWRRRRTARSA